MNLLLTIFLSVASVVGSFLFMKSQLKKAISMSLHGYSSSKLIGGGDGGNKPRAKVLDKTPLSNPNVSEAGSSEVGFSAKRIPDMRGANNGNSNLPATQGNSNVPAVGGGMGVTAVVGLVNGIGAVVQNGNVFNKFAAKRQLMGPVFQGGGMIYNIKPKGTKRLTQNANSILNASNRGRIAMKQGQGAKTAIAQGRVNIRPEGVANNYIYGDVKGIRTRMGNIHTRNLQLKGPSRPKSLFVGKLYAPKAKRIRIQELNNGSYLETGNTGILKDSNRRDRRRLRVAHVTPALAAGNNIKVNLNDINLQKNNGYSLQKQHYALNRRSNDYVTMIGMKSIFADPRNQGLSTEQKAKLYTLTRVNEEERVGFGNSNNQGGYDRNELFRQLVTTIPGMNTRDMRKIASEANRLKEERQRNQLGLAYKIANERVDLNKESMTALNNLLKDTSGPASTRFHNFVEENFKEEIDRKLTEDEIKEIEQQARENISKRDDIPLEQKEEEFEKEKAKLIEEKKEESTNLIEEIVKERILATPEDAESILGKEGSDALNEQLENIKNQRDKAVVQELIKQDLNAHANYLKKHPEQKSSNYYDIYKSRMEEEMRQDIVTATGKLYSQKSGNENQYRNNLAATNSQPQVNQSTFFVPRQVQDKLAGGGM